MSRGSMHDHIGADIVTTVAGSSDPVAATVDPLEDHLHKPTTIDSSRGMKRTISDTSHRRGNC